MDFDIIIAGIAISIAAAVLYRKSDMSILTLAVFMGMVLVTAISALAFEVLSSINDIFATESVESSLGIVFLFLPLIILEFAHMRHTKIRLLQRLPAAIMFAVLIVSSVLYVSPDSFSTYVMNRSNLATLTQSLYGWIIALAAALTLVEMALEHNFPHGSKPLKRTSAKKKRK